MKERVSHSFARCPISGISALEADVADLFLPFCEDDGQQKARNASEARKPFAAFGSFRQRCGDAYEPDITRTIEAPAKLESAACPPAGGLSQAFFPHHNEGNASVDNNSTAPIDCDRLASPQTFKPQLYRKLGKSFSTDLDREEAWERKKEQYLLEEEDDNSEDGEEYDADEGLYDDLCEKGAANESSCESDGGDALDEDGKSVDKHIVEHGDGSLNCVHLDVAYVGEEHLCALQENGSKKVIERMPLARKKSFARRLAKPILRTRTKSLTDEDMEELRGSIDLGFGFSYSERSNLKSTLPALELYYAINKNYVDAQGRSLPVSPLEGNVLARTNSAGSTSSPSSETWRISSPGDHPSQVKTRLRHWAQAVACSVKQGH